MLKEDSASKKSNMSLQKAIRKDWVSSHKGTIIGVGACVIAAAAAITLAVTRPWVSEAHVLDQTAAVVDGDKISEQEIADYVDKYRRYIGKTTDADWATFLDENSMTAETVRSQALNRLEQQKIISKAAKEAGITATAEEIDEKVADQRERAGLTDDDQKWNSWLDEMGYTSDSYRSEMEYGIIEDKYVATQITPTDPSDYSMQTRAKSNISDYTGRKAYRILFKLGTNATASEVNEVKDRAQAVIDELGKDATWEDFSKKADELSKDKDVSSGDLGWDCVSNYETLIQKELDTLEAGKMSDEPIRGRDGFSVIFCTESYLADDEGNLDIAAMPEAIAKVLRQDTYEESNKNPKNTFLSLLTYNHSIDAKDMPEGLPYDVDMSLSTYHENDDDGTTATDGSTGVIGEDGTMTLGDDGSTVVSADATDGTVVSAGDAGDATEADGQGEQGESGESGSEGENGKDEKPAVEPSDPTSVQTFGDSSEDEE